MIRIERASGFVAPAGSTRQTSVGSSPRRVLAQAVVVGAPNPEALEQLREAQRQLAALEANESNLILIMGVENTRGAIEQARASVAFYERAYAEAQTV